jgi:hypothetical protein
LTPTFFAFVCAYLVSQACEFDAFLDTEGRFRG